MQPFTGMNVIMSYAPKIFELAGYTNTTEKMRGTVIGGLTNVLDTFIAICLVERWGRKPTLTLGFLVMAAGMGVLGTMMHIGIHSPSAQYFAIAMLMILIVGFAISYGPLILVLCSEIQPLKGRDFGITCSTATNWIANMIVGATFLTMLNTLGNANTYERHHVLRAENLRTGGLYQHHRANVGDSDCRPDQRTCHLHRNRPC